MSLGRLANKVTVVTGSSSGLGRAIALAFASHGTKLVVCADLHPEARKGSGEEEVEAGPTHEVINKKYGAGKARFVNVDVGNSAQMKGAVEEAVREGGTGRLDVMVNNAGVGHRDSTIRLHQLTDEEWDRTM